MKTIQEPHEMVGTRYLENMLFKAPCMHCTRNLLKFSSCFCLVCTGTFPVSNMRRPNTCSKEFAVRGAAKTQSRAVGGPIKGHPTAVKTVDESLNKIQSKQIGIFQDPARTNQASSDSRPEEHQSTGSQHQSGPPRNDRYVVFWEHAI